MKRLPIFLAQQPITAREQDQANLAKLENLFEHLEPESATLQLVSPLGESFELPELVFHLLYQVVHELLQENSVMITLNVAACNH